MARYINASAFEFSAHCCHGEGRSLEAGHFALEDLTLVEEGASRLRFAPLGNRPTRPRVALVGITPGGQIETFAKNLARMDVAAAAANAAFHGAQEKIRRLLSAHGLARRMGVSIEGDLNANPDILTTSIVKCCFMTDEGYRFSAPDIAASPAASRCATRRFLAELQSFDSLKWVVVFGEPGWDALHQLHSEGRRLIDVLRAGGLTVLQLPHFAQNYQQQAIFLCPPDQEEALLEANPRYRGYAPKARVMRAAVLREIEATPTGVQGDS